MAETFISDIEKMYDFLELSKEEFLQSYSYLTEKEYDLTYQEFISDKTGNLADFMRTAENMLIEENTYFDNENTNPYKGISVTGEQFKDRIYQYAISHLNEYEYKEFEEFCLNMGC